MKYSDNRAGAGWKVLTARERDVIHPVAEGKSNKLIASELGISMRTVEAHRARIFHKMGVRNAVQLARTVCTSPEPTHLSEPASSIPNDLGWIPEQLD
jgi:DNA-binding NarL/FixJ family response regulator